MMANSSSTDSIPHVSRRAARMTMAGLSAAVLATALIAADHWQRPQRGASPVVNIEPPPQPPTSTSARKS